MYGNGTVRCGVVLYAVAIRKMVHVQRGVCSVRQAVLSGTLMPGRVVAVRYRTVSSSVQYSTANGTVRENIMFGKRYCMIGWMDGWLD